MSAPLVPLSAGHGITLASSTSLVDEGHLLVGGTPLRAVRLTSPQVSTLLRWMGGAAPAEPEARVLSARLIAAGMAHPRPPAEGTISRDDVLVLVPSGVRPEPGWLVPALVHLRDPGVGAVVPSALVLAEDRCDVGRARADLAVLLTRRILPEAPGPHAVEHTSACQVRRIPALVVRRSALPAPGAALPVPGTGGERRSATDLFSRTPAPTLPDALVAAGWSVRHEPRSRVRVEPLRGFGSYLRTCLELGTAAGESAAGHARGPELSWAGAAASVLALGGRPVTGALVALAGYTVAVGRLGLPVEVSARVVGSCVRQDARAVVRTLEEGWAPVVTAVCVRHPGAVAAAVSSALACRVPPVRAAALLAGALVRSAGVWRGAWRARRAGRPVPRVRPVITRGLG